MRQVLLAALSVCSLSCSQPSAPDRAAPPAEPAPAAPAAAPPAAPSSSGRFEDLDAPDAGGPLLLRTDAGLVPAARAERVLHIGDSMAPLVGNYLRPLFTGSRRYWVESAPSTSSYDWGNRRLLQDAMYKYDPEVILISLGSNELFDPAPERRAATIRQIVEDTRGRPCLWIGPPLWKKDTGFVRILKENLGHCRYFDSTRLRLPRMDDGRHPSWTGGYAWASAVWRELGGTERVPTTTPVKPD